MAPKMEDIFFFVRIKKNGHSLSSTYTHTVRIVLEEKVKIGRDVTTLTPKTEKRNLIIFFFLWRPFLFSNFTSVDAPPPHPFDNGHTHTSVANGVCV